ncbi:hypothetical protein [uncultured Dechloromonas sp.]|uniref:hypothetical protein n=1 Tax=uncultured Dechloromonas sp. TaxID=171719 RepID=UPI0025DE52BC|nr:hypothetical protein [uncultured Dechloromonas sp.]
MKDTQLMHSLLRRFLAVVLFLGQAIAYAAPANEQETLDFLKNSFSQVDINRISRISQEMSLEPDVAAKFWPRYQEYLHRQIALRDQQLATLTVYANLLNRKKLDGKAAKDLLRESLAQEERRVASRKQLITRISDTLTPMQQIRLYQIELLLDAQIRSGLLAQVPLAE